MAESVETDQFSLKWNNFSTYLTSGFSSHLTKQEFVDVTLAVDGHLLHAHKLVLSICSPFFKNIFKENPCQHPVIILNDMKCTEVGALLKFMYHGEVDVRQEDLGTLLKIARILKIEGLSKEINDEMLSFITYDNVQSNNCVDSEEANSCLPNSLNLNVDDETRKDVKTKDTSKRTKDSVRTRSSKKRCTESLQKDLIPKTELTENLEQISLPPKVELPEESEEIPNLLIQNSMLKIDTVGNELTELPTGEDSQNDTPTAVEPVTYRLSARGRPQLVHEGYVYNLTSRSEVLNRSHYRCAEQHRGCRGKCAVIAERFMPTGVHEHNHAPGYQSEYDYRKKKGLDTDLI